MTSFFRFVNKRAIYRLDIISLAHVTDFPVVNVHVDELSARIWQQKLCATLSANVNIDYRLPIKVYYRICTLRHIRIEIIHGSQNVF
jgi:adenine-specific DNA methylase